MANVIPEKLINFNVYLENNTMVGIADVKLPSVETLSETIKGAGIAGEIESPTLGHFAKMATEITFRTVTKQAIGLAAMKMHGIELRGAQQVFNPLDGTYKAESLKIVLRANTKKFDLGKLAPGAVTDTKFEGEVIYMKVFIGDEAVLEIDKLNFIYRVGGVDYLADVAKSLGML